MKIIWCLISLNQAFAATPLSFSARIQSEALAEEAIDLLHCVSERMGVKWELGAAGSPPPSVQVNEVGGALRGTFEAEGKKEFVLQRNGWRRVCQELVPRADDATPTSRAVALPTALPADSSPAASPGASKRWLYIGAAVATLAGGFILWRSARPTHRSFRME